MGILNKLPNTQHKNPEDTVFKIIILGVDGVGKTTNAGYMPKSQYWFFGKDFEVPTSLPYSPIGYCPDTYKDMMDKLTMIADEKDLGDLKSIIFDNLEHVFNLIDTHVVSKGDNGKIKTIGDFGHGKGYVIQEDCTEDMLALLQRIYERGINILMLGHTQQQMFTNPDGEDYLGNKALIRDKIYKKISAWCTLSGFAYKKRIVDSKEKKSKITIRQVRWESIGSSDGKNRCNLPAEMDFNLGEALKIAIDNKKEHAEMLKKIPILIAKLPDDRQIKASLTMNTIVGFEEIKEFYSHLLKATTTTTKDKK